jgi:hypothetical protein
MRIDLVTLCDAAVEVNGKLNILGTIDYFWTASLPYVHTKCALAVRLRWEGHEPVRKHRLAIQVVDSDGHSIATEFTRRFAPPSAPDDDVPQVRHLIVDLESLPFAAYGPYAVRVEIDGEELASLPFSVVPMNRLPRQRTAP